MSTRRRIARLESAPHIAAVDDDPLLLGLVRLLGQVDACVTPPRWGGPDYAAAVDGIRDYHAAGLKFTSGSAQAAGHMADYRARQRLEAEGWATVVDARCKLTPLGDRTARQAAGVALDQWVYEAILGRLGQADGWDDPRPNGWRSEFDLFGRAADQRDADAVAPLLAAGCVESRSSTAGVVFYRPTGRAWVPVESSTEYSAAASEVYTRAFCEAVESRRLRRYEGTEIFIPLSATR